MSSSGKELYRKKDQVKFQRCTGIITRGAIGSSSYEYMKDSSILGITNINPTEFKDTDIIGVSVNGARRGRVTFDRKLVLAVLNAGAVIVKDNKAHTSRGYNIGEQELEKFLVENGAICFHDSETGSMWHRSKRPVDIDEEDMKYLIK